MRNGDSVVKRWGGCLRAGLFLFFLLGLISPCSAQWMTQSIDLNPGWNAIYLTVQPAEGSIEEIFDGHPVESVWMWNKRFSPIDFDVDSTVLLPDDPHWLVWFPSSNPESFLTRLFGMSASAAYLVKVESTASPFSMDLKGQPRIPFYEWVPHALNLVGLPVNPANPPTLSDFFLHTESIDTTKGFQNELYQLDATGKATRIVSPARETIDSGRAYWIECGVVPQSTAPMQVDVSGLQMDFGSVLTERDLTVSNSSETDPITVTIRQIASEASPVDGGYRERAGEVPLSYFVYNATDHRWDWEDFGGTVTLTQTIAPKEEWLVRFGVRRGDFAEYIPTGTNGVSYQSILEITGFDNSVQFHVGVEAQEAVLLGALPGEPPTASQHPNQGLWVGEASLYQVNCPAYSSTNLLATDSICSFRLIIHVDDGGQARLLQEVFLAWDPLSTTSGVYRLYADREALPANAEEISRISSVNFPFMDPVLLTGSLTNALAGSVVVDCNDPLNPFLHRYNPMHDNKDWDYNIYTNAVETLSVSRAITLDFTDGVSSNAVAHPLWGVSVNGGTYRETLIGLRADPILVEGQFELQRISTLNTLNE